MRLVALVRFRMIALRPVDFRHRQAGQLGLLRGVAEMVLQQVVIGVIRCMDVAQARWELARRGLGVVPVRLAAGHGVEEGKEGGAGSGRGDRLDVWCLCWVHGDSRGFDVGEDVFADEGVAEGQPFASFDGSERGMVGGRGQLV